ncbi:MAG: MerR family transcriptional regulator [Bacteroidales bacterium]|nr:MerR family transcriptional regulator [Bacteroidales bacterium]
MEKLYYTIGETAAELGESVSLVRFWSNSFSRYITPRRNAKGNRFYRREDIDTLKQIHYLVKEKGYTLEGAEKILASERSTVDRNVRLLDALKEIRAQLREVREAL